MSHNSPCAVVSLLRRSSMAPAASSCVKGQSLSGRRNPAQLSQTELFLPGAPCGTGEGVCERGRGRERGRYTHRHRHRHKHLTCKDVHTHNHAHTHTKSTTMYASQNHTYTHTHHRITHIHYTSQNHAYTHTHHRIMHIHVHITESRKKTYRIAQKFRGSKFSRIAVFENFVEIISRIHSPKHATPTLCTA